MHSACHLTLHLSEYSLHLAHIGRLHASWLPSYWLMLGEAYRAPNITRSESNLCCTFITQGMNNCYVVSPSNKMVMINSWGWSTTLLLGTITPTNQEPTTGCHNPCKLTTFWLVGHMQWVLGYLWIMRNHNSHNPHLVAFWLVDHM